MPFLLAGDRQRSLRRVHLTLEEVQVNRKCGRKDKVLQVVAVFHRQLDQEGVGVGEHLPAHAAPLLRDPADLLAPPIDHERVPPEYGATHFSDGLAPCVLDDQPPL